MWSTWCLGSCNSSSPGLQPHDDPGINVPELHSVTVPEPQTYDPADVSIWTRYESLDSRSRNGSVRQDNSGCLCPDPLEANELGLRPRTQNVVEQRVAKRVFPRI